MSPPDPNAVRIVQGKVTSTNIEGWLVVRGDEVWSQSHTFAIAAKCFRVAKRTPPDMAWWQPIG